MPALATAARPCSRPQRAARLPLLARVMGLHDLWTQRRRLAALDDATLRDLGLTRGQAEAESRRPVWQAPDHWLR